MEHLRGLSTQCFAALALQGGFWGLSACSQQGLLSAKSDSCPSELAEELWEGFRGLFAS